MKITITSTPVVTEIDGRPCRLWEGVTESGHPCQVFVAAVAAVGNEREFEKELLSIEAPPESAVPLWMVAPGKPGGN